jgi:ribosomal protein S18 acetylase RimI-like enzyme
VNRKLDAEAEFNESDGLLRWIHSDLEDREFAAVLHDAQVRRERCPAPMRPWLRPLVLSSDDAPAVASYFKLLSGNVATLGGVRAAVGWDQAAAELIEWQVDQLRRFEISQIQAVVRHDDLASAKLVEHAGFHQVTGIEHQWLEVSQVVSKGITSDLSLGRQSKVIGEVAPLRSIAEDSRQWDAQPTAERRATLNPTAERRATLNPTAERRATLGWRPAHHFAHNRMAQFIESTFIDTLDCPAMNGRRSRGEVLDGFLDGRKLRQIAPWWEVLEVDGRVAGCLLLQQHSPELVELVYMGLLPGSRGQGLGKTMVQRAINLARQFGSQTLVVAVDEQNWPALDIYRRCGFQSHQRLQVWIAEA